MRDVTPIRVRANITGLKEFEQAVEMVNQKQEDLQVALNKLYAALDRLGLEINQPPAGTDD